MTAGLLARLGPLEMSGRRFRWEPGIYIRSITGIDGGAEVSFREIPRGVGVGVFDTENARDTPRNITVTAFAYERNDWALGQRKDQIASVLAENDESEWFVWQKGSATRRAFVRRQRFSEPVRRPGTDPLMDFTLDLRAPDQRIYGDPESTSWGSTVMVDHRGGYPAPVTIEVHGDSGGGYTITGPRGKTVVVNRPITAGSTHRYLADDGILLVDGIAQTEGVGRSDPVEIPCGRHQFSVNNGCELRVLFSPTWAP